jgi:sucrose-6-phosphate hydrolase SacC (GH32 family)
MRLTPSNPLRWMIPFRWLAALLLAAAAVPISRAATDDVLLFTYFRDNGQAGVFLAHSTDGVTFTPLNADRPIFTPPKWPGQDLTRDASILYHDGLFRMVWTSHWTGRVFGYAESRDLVTWSEPRQIRPFPESLPVADQPGNIWAPELHWDPFKRDIFVLFSSTTPRERTDGDGSDNQGNNTSPYDNRVYLTRTTDGATFTPARLFFDQGFSGIDAVMRVDPKGDRWVMVMKCSRNPDLKTMPGRNLRLTFTGPDLEHPNFTPISAPIAGTHSPIFSHPDAIKSMAEGQSLLRYRDQWWLYWDEPAGHGMQLATSPDLVTWTHVKKFTFPAKAKHGTAFLAPRAAIGWLNQPPSSH